MNDPKRLLRFLNVRPGKLKTLFVLLGLTIFCFSSIYSQDPCSESPFDEDFPVAAPGVIINDSIDLREGCALMTNPILQAGGEYVVQLAAFTSYEFEICRNSNGFYPQTEVWLDDVNAVANYDGRFDGADGDECFTLSYSSCDVEDIYFVLYAHECISSWQEFELKVISCTTCSITCSNQIASLDQDECVAESISLTNPTITGSCFELADLEYALLDENDVEVATGAWDAAEEAFEPILGLAPGCYSVVWSYEDGTCIYEVENPCTLCLNDVILSCKGGTREITSISDCTSSMAVSSIIKGSICEDTGGDDCFVYEASYNGTDWYEDDLPFPALGTYEVSLRVRYYTDCADESTLYIEKMVTCFTAQVVNNSGPSCSLGNKSSCNYCGMDNATDAPTFSYCGATVSEPTSLDVEIGVCGILENGDTDIDLNNVSTDANGFIDQLKALGYNILLPDCIPGSGSLDEGDGAGRGTSCNFTIDHIIERTWTAFVEVNGERREESCAEYIFVLKPSIDCIQVEDYLAECTGEALALEPANLVGDIANDNVDPALDGYFPQYAPYYVTPEGDTVSLLGTGVCHIAAAVKGDTEYTASCPIKSHLLRKWNISDWCAARSGDTANDYRQLRQNVKTEDTTAPTWDDDECPGINDDGGSNKPFETSVGTDCMVLTDVSVYFPKATDLCCDVDDYSAKVYFGSKTEIPSSINETLQVGEGTNYVLSKGFYRVDVTEKDACGNESDVCSVYIKVLDTTAPSITNNSANGQQLTLVDGKFTYCTDDVNCDPDDNCSADDDITIQIALMPTDGSDPVFSSDCIEFECRTDTVMIIGRFTDECGNFNDCMTEITFKGGASLVCDDLVDPTTAVLCSAYSEMEIYGTPPSVNANCGGKLEWSDDDSDLKCGTGTIIRTFFVTKDGAQVIGSNECEMKIKIEDIDLVITPPVNLDPGDCDTTNYIWNAPTSNSEDLCVDDVVITLQTPDEVIDETCPDIDVVRTWNITRPCDPDFTTIVVMDTVRFVKCCPDEVTSDLFAPSTENPDGFANDKVFVDLETSSDFTGFTFQLLISVDTDLCTVLSNTEVAEEIKTLCTNDDNIIVGDTISTGSRPEWSRATRTGAECYIILVWAGGVDDKPCCECGFTFYREILPNGRSVAGRIFNEELIQVEEVMVDLQNSSEPVDMTNSDGEYLFEEIPSGSNYNVIPQKDTNPLNGVTTYDIVLISQHILGLGSLSTPYKLIAADVNNDGQITTYDLVQLRSLILYTINDFPSNTSWRFVDAAYQFPDVNDPWGQTFPEQYEIVNLDNDMLVDFVAVKIGDVNCSAITSNAAPADINSRRAPQVISALDKVLKQGEEVDLAFSFEEIQTLNALQFTIGFDKTALEIVDAYSNDDKLHASNFGWNTIEEGALTFAWSNHTQMEVKDLFKLKVIAKREVKLSNVININSRFTDAISYNEEGAASELQLAFINSIGQQYVDNGLMLYQNNPNPFKEFTNIGFEIPTEGLVKLTVFDINGKLILSNEKVFARGYNEIRISKDQLSLGGVLYYQLDTSAGTASKKMIVID